MKACLLICTFAYSILALLPERMPSPSQLPMLIDQGIGDLQHALFLTTVLKEHAISPLRAGESLTQTARRTLWEFLQKGLVLAAKKWASLKKTIRNIPRILGSFPWWYIRKFTAWLTGRNDLTLSRADAMPSKAQSPIREMEYPYSRRNAGHSDSSRGPIVHTIHLTASVFEWEIAPGRRVQAWGFNRSLPGPLLEAREGDTLRVLFTNLLPEPTTVHWHGLRIPAGMDGTSSVQAPVQPGECFEYILPLPDAGTYWYHAHAHETVQMERGMYGGIVVHGRKDPVLDGDKIFLLDDMALDASGGFKQPTWFLPRWMERHNGREGDELLINGKKDVRSIMQGGQMERWRFINTASARYIHLSLGGHPFKVIAMDGRYISRPILQTELLLTPGERADIVVGPFAAHQILPVESLPFDRGTGRARKRQFGTIHVQGHASSIAFLPEHLERIPEIATMETPVTRHIVLHGRRNWRDGVDFTINGSMHLHDSPVEVGSLQIWEIKNPGKLDHPFHLHGFFFQVLSVNGVPPEVPAWKDTVNIPRGGVVRIAWLVDDRPGRWMYHCHILEHHAAGMMAHFDVVPRLAESQVNHTFNDKCAAPHPGH